MPPSILVPRIKPKIRCAPCFAPSPVSDKVIQLASFSIRTGRFIMFCKSYFKGRPII